MSNEGFQTAFKYYEAMINYSSKTKENDNNNTDKK